MTTEKLADSKAVIAFLTEKFPNSFSLKGEAKPLKIGVFQDLAARLADEECVSKTQLRQALRHYTNSWRYLSCIKVGAKRVDLDGVEGDEIEAQHAEHAQNELQESKKKFAEHRSKQAKTDAATKAKTNVKHTRTVPHSKARSHVDTNRNKLAEKKDRLAPLEDSMLTVGSKVKVKLGRLPAAAVITEIDKSDVYVQLDSGMVVRTTSDKLYK